MKGSGVLDCSRVVSSMNDQRSVTEQLRDLIAVANQKGLYDAADYLLNVVTTATKREADGEPPTVTLLNDYEERELFRNDFNSAMSSFELRTKCTYNEAKHVVLAIALNFGLISRESVKTFMGHCKDQDLPIKPGMTVTIKKGVLVKTVGKPPHLAGKTYKVKVHHLLPGSNQYRDYHGDISAAQNPKIVWPGPGGYWSEVDINDIPEANSTPTN